MKIDCRPASFFSYKYELISGTQRCQLSFNHMSEQGFLSIEGTRFEVEKQGVMSGEWHLKRNGSVEYRALKPNPFARRFEISGPEESTILQATGLGRAMTLRGPKTNLTISPNHPFTRRATIEGSSQDFIGAFFAFWLTALTWKRAAQASAG